MDRNDCMMCDFLGDDKYCSYYDVFFARCEDIKECPDGLDDDNMDECDHIDTSTDNEGFEYCENCGMGL